MTTTNGLSQGSRKVRIAQPLLDRFKVRKLEPRTLARALRAIAEWSNPCGAGCGNCPSRPRTLRTASLHSCVFGKGEAGEVSLGGLLARELAPLCCLRPARAWAVQNLGEVGHVLLRTHVGVFEGRQAGADAAVQTLLRGPLSLTYTFILVCFFFLGLVLAVLKI
jgi:hypothetical protein